MTANITGGKLNTEPIDYLAPDVPLELPWFELPLVNASTGTLQNYGELVDDYNSYRVEIVT